MLIVDDDQAQREVVGEILELEGVLVRQARTAEEAARLLDERTDVVLMDLHGVDADEIVADVSRRPHRPAVLVLSGDTRLHDHALRLGADGSLAKPYDLDELVAAITQVLDRKSAGDAASP